MGRWNKQWILEGIGSVDASHTYQQSGEYTICIKYEETQDNGDVCFQKDTCFSVCVQCGICEREELALNCFQLFGEAGDPSTYLANNSNFYIDEANPGYFLATGYYQNGPFSGHLLNPAVNTDCFVSKYDESCHLCSNFSISGDLLDQGLVIKYFNNGFYVAGISNSTTLNFPGSGTSGQSFSGLTSGQKVFLAKYIGGDCLSTQIPTLAWALVFGNSSYRTLLTDMDLDNLNNPILTGVFTGQVGFDSNVEPNTFTPAAVTTSGGSHDMFIVKFNALSGRQLFSKSLVQSTSNPGGIYPLGISVDPTNSDFYLTGYFRGEVDIDGVGGYILSGITSGAATFVSKFDMNGVLIWAYPILATGGSPSSFQSRGKDIEAYQGGFALGLEKITSLPINLERTFTSSYSNYSGPANSSHVIRYDDQGNVQCAQTLVGARYITELSVDGLKNIYFTGASNTTGDDQIFSSSNLGVINNSCEVKSFTLDGNGYDDAWSIAPIGSDEFVVIGRTNSLNLNPDPNGSVYYSAGSEPDIFIGKYSCECTITPDTINCCDNISVIAEKYFDENTMCTDSTCCYSVDLYNNLVYGIKTAQVNLLTPGWSFGTVGVATGLYVNGTSTYQFINNFGGVFPGNTLPGGFTDAFFNFCLIGQPGAASTQEIEFVWYEMTKSGACIAVCRDTITTDCLAPTCSPNCTEPVDMQIVCDSLNPNQYCLSFSVTNLSPYPSTGVSIGVVGTDFGLVPCGGTGYFDPLDIDFGTPLDPGNTSAVLCIKLISTLPILSPQDVCLEFGLIYSDTSFCFQDTQYCYQILPCCNPCEDIQIIAREIEVDSASCCYAIDLNIACAIDYFGKIEIEALTPGVGFGSYIKNPSWIYCTPPSIDLICLDYPATYLPSGYTSDVLQFCLDSTIIKEDLGCWKEVSAGGNHTLA
ncbi:MAG: hypothetical protein IPM92_08095 [Saprospiraceae bacterium]|nr:hypothetical protein [Saprospiraceae bacterium]